MRKHRWGRILLFGGTGTAHRAEFKTNVAYAGAKSALNILVQSVAFQFASDGITCNAVLPGFTRTEYNFDAEKKNPSRIPMLSVESVAESAMTVLKNPDLNGVLLRVDKGWSPFSAK